MIGFVAAASFPPNVTRGEHFQEGVAAPGSGQDPGTPGANGGIRRKRRCLAKWNDRQRGPLPKRGGRQVSEKRVAVVTGASRGIGLAIARRLVAEGCAVVIADLDQEQAQQAAASIDPSGDSMGIKMDVSNYDEVAQAVQQIRERYGRIDILVNNAGIIRRGTLETVTEEDWDAVITVNLKGTFNCCKHVVPIMLERGWGRIINVASIAAKLGDITSAPGYGPSKAGQVALTKTLARELAPKGITVNAVAPHAIETEMSAQWSDEMRQRVIAGVPMGRLGKPEEVAAAVAFLASDEAGFITGATLDINGGTLMD